MAHGFMSFIPLTLDLFWAYSGEEHHGSGYIWQKLLNLLMVDKKQRDRRYLFKSIFLLPPEVFHCYPKCHQLGTKPSTHRPVEDISQSNVTRVMREYFILGLWKTEHRTLFGLSKSEKSMITKHILSQDCCGIIFLVTGKMYLCQGGTF